MAYKPTPEQIAKTQAEVAKEKAEFDAWTPPVIKTGNVISYYDIEDQVDRIAWVTDLDPHPGSPFLDVQALNSQGEPLVIDGMIVEGMIMIDEQFKKVIASSLDEYKENAKAVRTILDNVTGGDVHG